MSTLPVYLSSFIGRSRDIDIVHRLILEHRLLTLTGPGGVGKTRLAVAVADRVSHEFPDGVAFVSLAATTDPDLVASTIVSALGLQEGAGLSPRDLLAAYLSERHALLLLDNFEQVAEASPLVSDLIAACPRLHVLATSRVPLRLAGEHELSVEPLRVPDPDSELSTADVNDYEGVALFVERARATRHDFQVTDHTTKPIAEICTRLDGLPLALELAAARIRMLTPQGMLARLDDHLPVFASGPRDAPVRQQTIRNTITWSYDLLSPNEQRLLRQLSVFIGGWTLEAAEAVCDPDLDIFEGITTLVEHNLVRQIGLASGAIRFSMLVTIREFGLELLANRGEEEQTRLRHAMYFVTFAEQIEPMYEGPQQAEAFDLLHREHPNLRAALDWLIAQEEVESGLRLAGALWNYWQLRGHLSEGRRYCDALLAMPGQDVAPGVRAKGLMVSGLLATWQQDYAAAIPLEEAAIDIWRELPISEQYYAWGALATLGDIAFERGDVETAQTWYEQLLSHGHQVGRPRPIAAGFMQLGRVARVRGDLDRAAALAERSLALAHEANDEWLISLSISELAETAWARGEIDRSRQLNTESLALFRQMNAPSHVPDILISLAFTDVIQGRFDSALTLLDESVTIAERIGDRKIIAWNLHIRGKLSQRTGNFTLASDQLRDGLKMMQSFNRKNEVIDFIGDIASLYLDLAFNEIAVSLVAAVMRACEELGVTRPSVESDELERLLTEARRRLPPDTFDAAWDRGDRMSLDEAVDEALAPLPESSTVQDPTPTTLLSKRELDVLRLLVEGKSNQEIAVALFISPHTAANHVASIMSKLGLDSRTAVATWAIRNGLP